VRHVHDEEHGVARFERVVDLLHHAAVELRLRLVHARSIHEDDLGRRVSRDALLLLADGHLEDTVDARTGRLRLMSDDREALAEQRVQQRGLACIRAADNRDESRAEGHTPIIAV
jgi:hypothetical protein